MVRYWQLSERSPGQMRAILAQMADFRAMPPVGRLPAAYYRAKRGVRPIQKCPTLFGFLAGD